MGSDVLQLGGEVFGLLVDGSFEYPGPPGEHTPQDVELGVGEDVLEGGDSFLEDPATIGEKGEPVARIGLLSVVDDRRRDRSGPSGDVAVAPADPLIETRALPWKIEVDQEVGGLQIDTLLCAVVTEEESALRVFQPLAHGFGVVIPAHCPEVGHDPPGSVPSADDGL